MAFNVQSGEISLAEHWAIRKILNDLKIAEPSIRRMAIVYQNEDNSIAYVRGAASEAEDDILAYIGMLDFAKMGFFQGLASVEPADSDLDTNGIGDTSWVDETPEA